MAAAAPFTTCLWFADEAEEAARHYVSIFAPDAAITRTQHYTAAGQTTHKQPRLRAARREWSFNPSVSFQVDCADQAEVDRLWEALGKDTVDPASRRCGWVADRYGVSWQVVPAVMKRLLGSEDREAADRAMVAMMGMEKLDIAALQKAYDNA
ncbi:3-demethylubiquinone-9 3-O-methyltransferase [Cordyceps fumosorosea ARSEF 2679]|uniref:3-demethylubiquinone-9 3-O-methyltransferase n=1 Tax=Cordyceps fumosorosea (strain ARSEF 2679) TaxID=1081104 RepID=A0A167W0J7_CORFA|nr:3-demethylubiquinone-9 3-O-methyltransferase [Cordyceps fumosorosea ARSEF 2679]OAA63185.1 3-demethylubiquinone-9 3-O-methyltransferase [Cordyceps fumosorosea ARSEF 2679]